MNVDAELAELSRTVDLGLLGRRIKAARLAAGLTQAQLAAPEMSPAYLSRIESGARRPDLRVLVRLAVKTGVPLEQLVSGIKPDHRVGVALDLDQAAIALALGRGEEAMTYLDRARPALSEGPAADLRLQFRVLEARVNHVLGNLDEAIIGLEDLVGQGDSGPHWLLASMTLTQCYLESGDPVRCVKTGERVLDVLASHGLAASAEAAEVATAIAAALRASGDHEGAVELCRSMAEPAPSSGADQLDAYLAASIAGSSDSDPSLAAAFASIGRARAEHARARGAMARFHANFAEMLLAKPEPEMEAARERLAFASALAAQEGSDPLDAASIRLSFAKVLVRAGDLDEALRVLPREGDLVGSRILVATRHLLLSQIEQRTGNGEAARNSLVEAARTLAGARGDRTTAQIWFELGAMFDKLGDKSSAGEAYRSAAEATGLAVAEPEGDWAMSGRPEHGFGQNRLPGRS